MPKYGSKYPWDRWVSTQAWLVEKGRDFHCLTESFQARVHIEANRREMKATTMTFEGRIVVFQFYDRDSLLMPNLKALPAVRRLMQ